MRLAVLIVVLVVPGAGLRAQPVEAVPGVLAVRPAPDLTFSLGSGPRPGAEADVPPAPGSPQGRGAWRGAKRGFLVGVGIGVAATAAAAVVDGVRGDCDIFCRWHIVGAAAVPFVVVTTVGGAIIGAATARPAPPAAPVPEP